MAKANKKHKKRSVHHVVSGGALKPMTEFTKAEAKPVLRNVSYDESYELFQQSVANAEPPRMGAVSLRERAATGVSTVRTNVDHVFPVNAPFELAQLPHADDLLNLWDTMANEVFKEKKDFVLWLRSPNVDLASETPLSQLQKSKEEGLIIIEDLLIRLQYGVMS